MTARKIIDRIKMIIQDPSFTDQDVLDAINAAVHEASRAVQLPALAAYGTVTTGANAFAALPSNYMRDLHYVHSSKAGGAVAIQKSFNKFLRTNPDLTMTGNNPDVVCIYGMSLYYQPIPTVADTLTLYYFKSHTPIESVVGYLETAEVTVIPIAQHEPILVCGGAAQCFKIIEDGLEPDQMVGFKKYSALAADGVQALKDLYGPDDGHPDYIEDEGEYCTS